MRADRADAVVDRARAGIVKRQADKSVRLEAAQDFVADRPVQHLLQMLDGAKQKRHREHIHRRHEGPDQRHVGAIEVDRAGPGLLDGLLFLAELARMKDPDLVAAAGALGDQAAHVAQRLYGRIVLALGIGGAKFARDRARRDRRQKQRDNDASRSAKGRRGCTRATSSPYDDVDGREEKVQCFLAEAGGSWLSCQRR